MKRAVDCEVGGFVAQCHSTQFRTSFDEFNVDRNITEFSRRKLGRWEGEDIGGFIHAPMIAVEGLNFLG